MFSCKQVSVLVSATLERKLSWIERLRVRGHLLFCKACRNFARQMTTLHTAAQQLTERNNDVNPSTLPGEARARIKKTLCQCEQQNNEPKS